MMRVSCPLRHLLAAACLATLPATATDGEPPTRETFIGAAREAHGDFGARAATFLVAGMPPRDREALDDTFLLENLKLALEVRESFPWAHDVPEDLFFNDVLPYACLDEAREPWRREFLPLCRKIVKGCTTAGEAAQTLNRDLFDRIAVKYDTGRKAPNQSPSESRRLGKASCTGLSIILVNACRAVGIPARIAGTPMWTNKRGNHTWVEVHDGQRWRFTGADEHHPKGLDHAWFIGDASKAQADDWRHAIWATSWKPTGSHFPLVWNLRDTSVHAVNVTDRYTRRSKVVEEPADMAQLHLRLLAERDGHRLVGEVAVRGRRGGVLGRVRTKAGTTDRNDMPVQSLPAGRDFLLHVCHKGEWRRGHTGGLKGGASTLDLVWAELDRVSPELGTLLDWEREKERGPVPNIVLHKADATEAARILWGAWQGRHVEALKAERAARVIKAAGKEMKFLERRFGEKPGKGHALWISMHGGGGAPSRVNDGQWKNQIRLYEPEEGIVVAPRAPTDTWNLWHQGHIDDLFDRLITAFVATGEVDPDRVYLMGYSAGGDGVYQLAPRMADRFAAAAMMAGHPNDASPLGLRNLPFMLFVGGRDAAYKRNQVAAEWGRKLGALRRDDPGGYPHKVTIYPELGHWMNGRDAEALPWMARHTRNPWPKRVVWKQSSRVQRRFYWLELPPDADGDCRGHEVRAEVDGQVISIESDDLDQLHLRLSDALVDLDREVVVRWNGEEIHRGKVERRSRFLWNSLQGRPDPGAMAVAGLSVRNPAARGGEREEGEQG